MNLKFAYPEETGPGAFNELTSLGEMFDGENFDWEVVRSYGLSNHCPKVTQKCALTCGKVLARARHQIENFVASMGLQLCVFKIGVSSNPVLRFVSYLKKNYSDMWVVSKSCSVDLIHMLEAALISHYALYTGCRNQLGSGGEGALNRANPPRPPYFLYVVGGMANQPRRLVDENWLKPTTVPGVERM